MAEDMGGDEIFAAVVGLGATALGLARWYWPLVRVTGIGRGVGMRDGLAAAPPLGYLLLWRVLRRWAAHEVRDDGRYLVLFMAAEGVVILAALATAAVLGISYRDDAVERRNPAAGCVVAAGLWAATICFAGGNIGEGATIWTTLFPAGLAVAALCGLWLLAELSTGVSTAVTVERDMGSALRLSGALMTVALVLGRAVAGDFVSWGGTVRDFGRDGWPAAVLILAFIILQRTLRREAEASISTLVLRGVIPALLLLALAGGWLIVLGPWR